MEMCSNICSIATLAHLFPFVISLVFVADRRRRRHVRQLLLLHCQPIRQPHLRDGVAQEPSSGRREKGESLIAHLIDAQ